MHFYVDSYGFFNLWNDSRRMWQGIQTITNFRGCATTAGTNYSTQLAEELNCFFARFEATQQNTVSSLRPVPAGNTPALTLQEHEVRRVLRSVNPRKATGPDGVPGKVLGACADQLTPVLHQYLQSVPVTSHHTTLPEVSYHHTNPQNIFAEEPQWLPPSGTYTGNHEMLWEAGLVSY